MKSKTKDMILCGIFAAIICICSIISLPIGAVPVTLGTFGVMVTSSVLGVKRGVMSVMVFVLIGAVGLPVFSGFHGGVGVLTGPTGGYITGYILMPLVAGLGSEKSLLKGTLCNGASNLMCYIVGTVQYALVTGASLQAAITLCVAPFILIDIAKSFGAALLSQSIKKHI